MKKIIISLLLTIGLFSSVYAQDTRTRETKIADIVMQLPAGNTAQFNQLMGELSQLGDVVSYLAPRLADPGGNDAQIRYAIGGLSMYASKDEARKGMVAQGLCKAIPLAKSDEIRDFLFIQLQYVAGAGSVETAAQYLNNSRLCDPALRVLVRIHDVAANQVMLDALKKSGGIQQVRLVEALGDTRYQPAAEVIASLAGSSNAQLQKAVLHSLAEIASPASGKVLVKAAEAVGYVYEPTDALGSYVLYLGNSLPGQSQAVANASKNLLKATSENKQLAAKTAALDLLVRSSGEKAINEIMNAIDSDNEPYRLAAMKYSASVRSSKMDEALLKKAKGVKNPEVQAEMITTLGERGTQSALPFVLESMKKNNPEIMNASIVAAGLLGKEKAISPIINIMAAMAAPGNKPIIDTAKGVLLTLKSEEVIPAISAVIPKTTFPARIAFMEILGSKKAQNQSEVIFSQVDNINVGLAAKQALKEVVTSKDVQRVAQLLNASAPSDKEGTSALQQALYAAVSSTPKDQQFKSVAGQMNKTNNPVPYYNVLAMIGGKEGLDVVLKGFDGGGATRSAAFEALTLWSDASATGSLYKIAASDPSGAYFDKALAGYIAKASASKDTPEQKLLQLRKALEIAKSGGQKQDIIRQIARTGTFLGLLTVGEYLDSSDSQVQQAAVQAVRSIALGHKEYYGPQVTALLNKAMAVNKDSEAEYQKQAILKHLAALPQAGGFVSMFNGKDLSGWKGLVENPIARGKMTAKQLADKQKKADEIMRRDWKVENGLLVFEGKGYDNLCSQKMYGDFELYVDWKIAPEGDAGIYLRGTPQVQIWDIALTKVGAQVGSGGLYNNQKHESKPLVVADNPVNEWNSFRIQMIGEKVIVYLNGQLVTDNVTLENFWDRALPIFEKESIELQAHGTRVEYRDIYVREIPRPEPYKVSAEEKAEGFVPMFNGIDMSGWIGNIKDYFAKEGIMVCDPAAGGRGNVYTDKEYSDFIMRFDFQLTPAANNGLGIRTPLKGDAAYEGMEIQILDNEADVYKDLQKYQYHGSVYGVIAAKRGSLKPVGEWNTQEVIAQGNHIKVTLNGTVILDGDIAEASKNFTQTADGKKHPGLSNKSGYIGFLGHGSVLAFRNLRIKDLSK